MYMICYGMSKGWRWLAYVYAFFGVGKGLLAGLRHRVLAWIISAVTVIAAVAVLACGASWALTASNWLFTQQQAVIPVVQPVTAPSPVITRLSVSVSTGTPAPGTALFRRVATQDVIGRDPTQQTDVLTGRTDLWRAGLEKFRQRPVFGYGYVGGKQGVYRWGEPINHFHNLLVQSLVTAGLAGTLPLLAFAVVVAVYLVRYGWRRRHASFADNQTYYAGVAFIALYAVHNMVEVFLVYAVSLPHFLFWIWLGYFLAAHRQSPPPESQQQSLPAV